MHFADWVLKGPNRWSQVMLPGPSDVPSCRRDYKVFRSAMMVGDHCLAAALDAYEEFVCALVAELSGWWGIVYKAGEAMRSSQWDAIRSDIASPEGGTTAVSIPPAPGRRSFEIRSQPTVGGTATSAI